MANAAIDAAIAAASALAVKHRLADRTFRVLYAPFEALVPVSSLSHPGALRIA